MPLKVNSLIQRIRYLIITLNITVQCDTDNYGLLTSFVFEKIFVSLFEHEMHDMNTDYNNDSLFNHPPFSLGHSYFSSS